jgi:predicted RND superfamily exporter protein
MVPNILPLLLNFGLMGLLHIPLDVGTVMIASLALGIAVDNTIHMVVVFRRFRETGSPSGEALEQTLLKKGRPILHISMVVCAGFLVLAFSSFLPMAWFGVLTALTFLWALGGDLILLPALLIRRRG